MKQQQNLYKAIVIRKLISDVNNGMLSIPSLISFIELPIKTFLDDCLLVTIIGKLHSNIYAERLKIMNSNTVLDYFTDNV